MEEVEEKKGYQLISSSHVHTTPSGSGGQQASKQAPYAMRTHAHG